MKELILSLIKKYRKYVIIGGSGLGLLIIGLLSWTFIFSKFQIFDKQERLFTKAAIRYYEYHKQALPRDGESRDITLQDLYDKELINDIYVPKTKKTCDVNSWVRVYKDKDGEYKYLTYLKCGRFSSHIDHEGPKITLNGDAVSYIPYNTEYQEQGVKEVIDNKDKKIDIAKVVIDSSLVNTKKLGTYNVTYTVKDSKYNKTIVTRQVIVSKGFSDTVKANTSADGYYKGISNNYVLFSGMLFRIVKVNEDNSVKLILDQPVNNMRANYEDYKLSGINTWLNNVFYNSLVSNNYLVKSTYCVGDIKSLGDYSDYCSKTIKANVGLLDVDEYKNTFEGNTSSILSTSFMLGHLIGDKYADATFSDYNSDGTANTILAPIRPVITVSSGLNILSGDGSYDKPYKLNDYSYAKKASKLNSRIIGEYFTYSGLNFRIIGYDGENVRAIMASGWTVKPNNNQLYISYNKAVNATFDLKNENNPAYIINNEYLDYIDTKSIVDTTYLIPTNDSKLTYNKYKTKKVTAKIVLPTTYELFSNVGSEGYMYTYIDKSTTDQLLFMANSSTGKVFEISKDDFEEYAIKAVITVKGNLRIESGKGTKISPYKLR